MFIFIFSKYINVFKEKEVMTLKRSSPLNIMNCWKLIIYSNQYLPYADMKRNVS